MGIVRQEIVTEITCDKCGSYKALTDEMIVSNLDDLVMEDSDVAEFAEGLDWYTTQAPRTYEEYCYDSYRKRFLPIRMYCPFCAEKAKAEDEANQKEFEQRHLREMHDSLPGLETDVAQ